MFIGSMISSKVIDLQMGLLRQHCHFNMFIFLKDYNQYQGSNKGSHRGTNKSFVDRKYDIYKISFISTIATHFSTDCGKKIYIVMFFYRFLSNLEKSNAILMKTEFQLEVKFWAWSRRIISTWYLQNIFYIS